MEYPLGAYYERNLRLTSRHESTAKQIALRRACHVTNGAYIWIGCLEEYEQL